MKITYRTKTTPYGIGIQVDSEPDEDITNLIDKLTDKGFKYIKSNIPPSFNKGIQEHNFNRIGSDVFGFKTPDELHEFVIDSADILILFDGTFNPTVMYTYDNK